MNNQLKEYQAFIDHLAKMRPCILIQWVHKGWPRSSENQKINEFLSQLSHEQKEILGLILQQAKDEGIGDVFGYLTEETNMRGLRISRDGVELATEPYGTEMTFDWIARSEGNSWPEHQLKDKYKSEDQR